MGLHICAAALHLFEISRGEFDQILYVMNITLNALHCSDTKLLKLLWKTARVMLRGMGEASKDVHHLVQRQVDAGLLVADLHPGRRRPQKSKEAE